MSVALPACRTTCLPELVVVVLDLVAIFLEDGLDVGAVLGLLLFLVPAEDVGTTLLTVDGVGVFWLTAVLAGEALGVGVTKGVDATDAAAATGVDVGADGLG